MTSEQSADTPHWDVKDLRRANVAAGVALWSWNVDTDRITMDEHGFRLWDVGVQSEITFEDLSAKIHPHDRDRVRNAFAATRAIIGAFDIDFRILSGEAPRWISARGQGDDADIKGSVMFGIFLDVTDRRQAEEAHELLAGEMSHRVKNLLAIASSLTMIASRSASRAEELAHDLTTRLAALGRAHDLVRPKPSDENGALVGDLISVVLAPYDDMEEFTGRVRVSVPRIATGDGAATNIALILHELATNSVKYGALSVRTGTIDISGTVTENDVVIVWTEQGGPEVVATPVEEGFGSKLVTAMIARLGGTISTKYLPEGVVVKLNMKKNRVLA